MFTTFSRISNNKHWYKNIKITLKLLAHSSCLLFATTFKWFSALRQLHWNRMFVFTLCFIFSLKWAFLCSRFWILGLKTPQGVTKAQLTSVSNSKLSWFSTLSSLIRYNSFSISTSVLYGVSRTLVRPAYNNFPQATQAEAA